MTPRRPEDCGSTPDVRCLCGGLLARWRGEAIELKCRRCKRTLLIPRDRIGGAAPNPRDKEAP
ncbi:MAG: hypothetical protein ACOYXU_04075 [Nitrospirota bacterium]